MRLISKYGLALVTFIAVLMLFSSCGSRKSMVYLQQDSSIVNTAAFERYIPKIQVNDILTISVTAADPKVTAPFNYQSTYVATISPGTEMAMRPTYTVDSDGNITFPLLGKVKLEGLTRMEAIAKIRDELSTYIKDPGVNMNFNSFRVSVLGEVKSPGSFIMPTDRITVLEALGMAGDLTIRGVRTNVMVVREVNGVKSINRLDLTKQETLNSPYYYLAQNDVVYVEPSRVQINNSKLGANTNIIISVASLMITVISLLTR